MIWILLILLSSLSAADAATNIAASASLDDVNVAYALCSDGDTLQIPAGTSPWTNHLNWSKGITIMGAGPDSTILVDEHPGTDTNGSVQGQTFFVITMRTNATYRLSNIGLRPGTNTTDKFDAVIQIFGTNFTFRADHMHTTALRDRVFEIYGWIFGVIYSNRFSYSWNGQPILYTPGSIFNGESGDGAWQNDALWGTSNRLYVEDNIFDPDTNHYVGIFDGWDGAEIAFRHNIVSNSYGGIHGSESSQRLRGARLMEVYGNQFWQNHSSAMSAGGFPDHAIDVRSGSLLLFSNSFDGPYNSIIKMNDYRAFFPFPPWLSADGTKDWDSTNHILVDAGQSTAARTNGIVDTTKSWAVNSLVGSVLRETNVFTATGGSLGVITVAGAGWHTDQWQNSWEVTKLATNEKGLIVSNTATVLLLHGAAYQPMITNGDVFVISRGCEITANTATTITTFGRSSFSVVDGSNTDYTNAVGQGYEIRTNDFNLDQSGMGRTTAFTGPASPLKHQNINQQFEPIYEWVNIYSGLAGPVVSFAENRMYPGINIITNTVKPGYTPFTYPHPLTLDSGGGNGGQPSPTGLSVLGINGNGIKSISQ